jgi:hypothetical protein
LGIGGGAAPGRPIHMRPRQRLLLLVEHLPLHGGLGQHLTRKKQTAQESKKAHVFFVNNV